MSSLVSSVKEGRHEPVSPGEFNQSEVGERRAFQLQRLRHLRGPRVVSPAVSALKTQIMNEISESLDEIEEVAGEITEEWTLEMSTYCSDAENTVEALQDTSQQTGVSGSLTEFGAEEWVQAVFPKPTKVAGVTLGIYAPGQKGSEVYGPDLVNGRVLQYWDLAHQRWQSVHGVAGLSMMDGKLTVHINCEEHCSTHWRVYSNEGPVALGTFMIFKAKFALHRQHWFEIVVAVSIIINAIQMGIQVDTEGVKFWDDFFGVLEHVWVCIFFLEMMVKIFELRAAYFYCGFNLLDFVLVSASVFDTWIMEIVQGDSSGLQGLATLRIVRISRIIRLLRLLRLVRLLRVFKQLFVIVQGLIAAVKPVFWAMLMLTIIVYAAAIVAVRVIGQSPERYANTTTGFDPVEMYGTLPRAMYTLFTLAMGDDIMGSLFPIMMHHWELLFLLYAPFMMMTTFGVMNVVVGVIVDSMISSSREQELEQERSVARAKLEKMNELISEIFHQVDIDNNGSIDVEELEYAFRTRLIDRWDDLPLVCSAEEVYDLVDVDGDGDITDVDFAKTFFRLAFHTPNQNFFLQQMSTNRIARGITEIHNVLGIPQGGRGGDKPGRTTSGLDPDLDAAPELSVAQRLTNMERACATATQDLGQLSKSQEEFGASVSKQLDALLAVSGVVVQ